MDKHSHTLLSMDHPNISHFIKPHCHKLIRMFDLLDYQSIHLNKCMHMHGGKGLHKLIDFWDIEQHKVLFNCQQKSQLDMF